MSARSQALRGLILPGVLSLIVFAILIALGTWQLQRLAWKERLMANAASRVSELPRPLPFAPDWQKLNLEELEYRPYSVSGRFLNKKEVLVHTVLSEPKHEYSGVGYWVLTPLELEDGSIVIVNRGFVPAWPVKSAGSYSFGWVHVTGLLRAPEKANYFTPENNPARDDWYRRDPADIARAKDLKNVAPFLLDMTAKYYQGMRPQPNETKLTFVNNHLGYALTWYGLAATLIGVFSAFAWQRLRASRL
jgi:surfeit locus 1 family protein